MKSSRLRDFGLAIGSLPTGTNNSITDVPGVRVGQVTLISGNGPLVQGRGPVRTGVTVILPHGGDLFREKVRAAVHALNGHTKAIGLEQVRELGLIESPIALTNTLNAGLVADGIVEYMLERFGRAEFFSFNPVVGETNDSFLNDIAGRHVKQAHVLQAITAAVGGPVEEGAVGAGAGTSCFGWKGGIGTSSRQLPADAGDYVVAVLVQSNFGSPENLVVCGIPVGQHIQPPPDTPQEKPQGSIMMVLATNAPLNERQLGRLCVRAGIGLGRVGGIYGNSSGDVVIAFSTAHRVAYPPSRLENTYSFVEDDNQASNHFFHAAADCVEEAILNSLFTATTVVGRDEHTRHALPIERVVALVKRALAAAQPAA